MGRGRTPREREFDAAFELLAQICADGATGSRADAIDAIVNRVDDWDEFLFLVGRHRVPGLAFVAISRPTCGVPDRVRDALAADARVQSRRNLVMATATIDLQKRFAEAGIPAIFFKGAALGERAYDSLTVKHGKDIDFLLPAADVERGLALLSDEGYRLVAPREWMSAAQWRLMRQFGRDVLLVQDGTNVPVELHWRLTENPLLLPLDELVAAAGEWDSISGRPIRGFHPDDQFVYLCVHGECSGWFRLKWLADLHAVVAQLPADELIRLYRHAEARGAGPSAALALALCRTLLGLSVPRAISPALEKRLVRIAHALCLRILRERGQRCSNMRRCAVTLTLALAHGERQFVAECARWAINIEDVIAYPLPTALYFLYPVIRLPLWVARRVNERLNLSWIGQRAR